MNNEYYKIYCGDCLELMQQAAADKPREYGPINLVLTDPPYNTIEGLRDDAAWDIKIPTRKLLNNISSVLTQKGRALIFSQYPYSVELAQHGRGNLEFQYFLYWIKNQGQAYMSANKAPLNVVETIAVFNNKYDTQYKNPLRKYADNVWDYIGRSMKEIEEDMGNRAAEHFLYRSQSTQFSLCTEDTYNKLIQLYNIDKMENFKPYKELKEMNTHGESVFNIPEGRNHVKNTFYYKRDPLRVHPTQKPVKLLEELIKMYTNPGDIVLDCCMGSGSTGVACMNTGRHFLGIEKEQEYYKLSVERLKRAVEYNNF